MPRLRPAWKNVPRKFWENSAGDSPLCTPGSLSAFLLLLWALGNRPVWTPSTGVPCPCLLVGFSPLQALTGNLKVSSGGEVGVFIFWAPPCIPAVLAVAVFLYLELQLLWAPLQTLAFCLKGGNGLVLAPAGSLASPHILWVLSPCQPL